jgi:hypothetical protein
MDEAIVEAVCQHAEYETKVQLVRYDDWGMAIAVVRIMCKGCGLPVEFIGMEDGMNFDRPSVCKGGMIANLPIKMPK